MRSLCAAVLLAVAAGATADLLWDNGDFDGGYAVGNGRGTGTYFGAVNLQAADDFEIVGCPGWSIGGVYFEGICFFGNLQVDFVTIAFFEDNGEGLPKEDEFYSEDAYDITVIDYYDPDWGYYHVEIDARFGPAVLDPGYYWIVMQPYGLWGDWFYQGCTTQQWREYCASRDLGYPGPGFGWPPDGWEHVYDYDLGFRISGEVVPEPGLISVTGVLLGFGGLCLRRK